MLVICRSAPSPPEAERVHLANHLVRPRGIPDRDRRACGSSSTRTDRRTRGDTSRSPSRPISWSSATRTTAITAISARSCRRSRRSARSSCRRRARSIRGIRFEAIHVFETPERLPEDEVTIVHFRSEGLHRRIPGRPGPPAFRDRAGPAPRRRNRAGRRRRPADDRLSRDPRAARRDRPAHRDPDALQDAQDQPEHPAAGTVPGVIAVLAVERPGRVDRQ